MRLAPLLALALLLPVPATAAEPAPRPVYAVGDFWLYRLNSTEGGFFALHGTLNVSVGGFTRFPANGTPVVEVLFSGDGELRLAEGLGTEPVDGTWAIRGSEYWETENYKILRRYLRVAGSGTGRTSGQAFTFEIVNTTVNDLRSDTWTFPLLEDSQGRVVANASYNATTAFHLPPLAPQNSTENGTYVASTTLTALGAGPVTVPAGTWSALTVNETTPAGWTIHRYAPVVGGDLRTEAFNATGAAVSRLDLLSFRYRQGELASPPDVWPWVGLGAVAAAGISAAVLLLRRRRRGRPSWRAYEEDLREAGGAPSAGPGDPPAAPRGDGGSSLAGKGRGPPSR
jgi:hypothetical protein